MRLQLTVKMFWQADKVNRQGEKEMQARVEPQFGKRTPDGVLPKWSELCRHLPNPVLSQLSLSKCSQA